MTEQEHLKNVLADLRSKERVARDKARTEFTKADTFAEAADVVEVELTRIQKASTPANPVR